MEHIQAFDLEGVGPFQALYALQVLNIEDGWDFFTAVLMACWLDWFRLTLDGCCLRYCESIWLSKLPRFC